MEYVYIFQSDMGIIGVFESPYSFYRKFGKFIIEIITDNEILDEREFIADHFYCYDEHAIFFKMSFTDNLYKLEKGKVL